MFDSEDSISYSSLGCNTVHQFLKPTSDIVGFREGFLTDTIERHFIRFRVDRDRPPLTIAFDLYALVNVEVRPKVASPLCAERPIPMPYCLIVAQRRSKARLEGFIWSNPVLVSR
jgi:hypothetical protein